MVDVDIVSLFGVHMGHETEGDTPDTSHRNCEHSWGYLKQDVMSYNKARAIPDCVSSVTPTLTMFVEECRSLSYLIFEYDADQEPLNPHQIPF